MIKVLHVVGARPNYMKVAPIFAQMQQHPQQFEQILVHTGQHYDANMSDVFFRDLGLKAPDHFLGVGSGTHAQQTAQVMLAFEPIVQANPPDLVLVVGDVNSTLACALVCSKLGLPVGHVEAGLRSFDRTMPEEINRILTDQLADLLLIPSPEAKDNLLREGVAPEKIHFVGNVMIDSLTHMLPSAMEQWAQWQKRLPAEKFMLVTLHRPSNVDQPEPLGQILAALVEIAAQIPVVFPLHPRTRQRLSTFNLRLEDQAITLLEPLGYLDFLALESHAAVVVTDSGGVQEESTYLGIPCCTLRSNTERPVTISQGTNQLVPVDRLPQTVRQILANPPTATSRPDLWDGQSAQRIVKVIQAWHKDIK
jgi:UDP-N-acetylglucosamine 2-epimerase (non-hydrolysing)